MSPWLNKSSAFFENFCLIFFPSNKKKPSQDWELFLNYLTDSFKAFPALKAGTLLAGI